MSLTQKDLDQIRQVVHEVVRGDVEYIVGEKLKPIAGEIEALRNDIKEIYDMIAKLEKRSVLTDNSFQNNSVKEQILKLNAAVVALAQKEGITLPR